MRCQGFSVDGVGPGALVAEPVKDKRVGGVAEAQAIEAAKALLEGRERRGLCDEGVKVKVCADLNGLGGDDDRGPAVRVTLACGMAAREQLA